MIPKGEDLVLWPAQHPDGIACKLCPSCILFPAMIKLDKLCSHAALLQVPQHPDHVEDESKKEMTQKDLDFAKVALPRDVLQYFGGSYIRDSSIMGQHLILSGKLRTLKSLLNKFQYQKDKVLVFSYSTDTLDLIESQVKLSGFNYLRLDGKTQTSNRQMLVDKFQNDEKITLFLISTKAGGMGLNLTAANRVIIYDVNWSPSHDEQAQDRAFRIGQHRDVEVIRLIAQGTIEELRYARQLYKTHIKQESLESSDYATAETIRMFRGVQGDSSRKGELFGLENLLKFKDGSFTKGKGTWKTSSNDPSLCTLDLKRKDIEDNFNRDGDTEDMEALMEVFNHDQFLREDGYGDHQQLNNEDEEFGGESQMAHEVLGGCFKNDAPTGDALHSVDSVECGLSVQSAETELLISAVKRMIPSDDGMSLSDSNSSTNSQDKVESVDIEKKEENDVPKTVQKVQQKRTALWDNGHEAKGRVNRKPINLFRRKQDQQD
jgi:superfamily II DNA/RNA helicase